MKNASDEKADALGLIATSDEPLATTGLSLTDPAQWCAIHETGSATAGVTLWFGQVCRLCLFDLIVNRRLAVVPSNLEAAITYGLGPNGTAKATVEDDGSITVGETEIHWA